MADRVRRLRREPIRRTSPLHGILTHTMVAELSALESTVLRDVDAALDPLRRKQRDLQAFMASQLERLEMLAGRMDDREADLDRKADELVRQRAALDEEWTHLDALVETAQANALEMRQERQRLEAQARDQQDAVQGREVRRLREQLTAQSQERSVLETELAAAQRKVGQLADVAVELAEARAEVERLKHEPARVDTAAVHELQQKLTLACDERDRLAAELRRVKQQEAERARQFEAEARRFGEERVEWLAELRSMRRSLEHAPAAPPETRTDADDGDRAERTAAENRQFEQVLDQFEAVKRDVAKRRPRKPH